MNELILRIDNIIEKIILFIEKNFYLFFLILLFISLFNIFKNIDIKQLNNWDEARHGISAYEMLENNNFIINTFLNKKDYWYLKPPLGLILIAFSYKIFGYSVFAMRFTSAFFGFLCVVIIVLSGKYLFNGLTGLLSGFILISSLGYLFDHAIREGNLDSQIALLILLSIVSFTLMDKNRIYFYFIALLSSFGFLIKSFAGLQIIIIFFVLFIIFKKYQKINLKDFIIFLFIFIAPILIWVVMRYFVDGFEFFRKMINYDLLARTKTSLEGHTGGYDYYYQVLKNGMKKWFYFFNIILFLFILKIFKKEFFNVFLIDINEKIIWIYTLVLFLILSVVKTKCYWYAISVYPLFSTLIGIYLARFLKLDIKKNVVIYFSIKIFLIILFFSYLIYNQIKITKDILFIQYSPDYETLLKIKSDQNKNFYFYENDAFSQSNIFVVKIIKKLNPVLIDKNKQEFIKNYISGKEKGYLFLKNKNLNIKINSKFIFLKNDDYIILKNFS